MKLNWQSHVFIHSSGTTGHPKWVCLSKKAMLISAEAVNKNIQSDSNDIWLQALPSSHVGGLAIYFRAYTSGAEVIEWHSKQKKWDADQFYDALVKNNITLTSLVPTQVFDLVKSEYKVPASVRAVLVGGAALSENLYLKARALGWPLLPSYGMTETASQIASADLESLKENKFPKLKLLPHAQVKLDEEKTLHVKSKSLFSCYLDGALSWNQLNSVFISEQYRNLKTKNFQWAEWFKTSDVAETDGTYIDPKGRANDQFKISGELCSKSELEKIFYNFSLNSPTLKLFFKEDERLGLKVTLIAEKSEQESQAKRQRLEQIINAFNQAVRPFEKIREIAIVDAIPKTALGKFKQN